MDLHTNLRGFAHKPSWICTQTGIEGPGFRFFTGLEGPGFRFFIGFPCFPPIVQFFRRRGGSRVQVFSLLFFHGLEGPGFRIFTGLSKGQGSGFSLVFQVFYRLFSFFVGVGSPEFRFSLFFFHGLEGPGFGFFTGVEGPEFGFSLASET